VSGGWSHGQIAGRRVSFAGFELPLPAGTDLSAYDGRTIVLGIRPSDLEDADVRSDPAFPTIEVTADVT
jgi:hypothetical protein